MKKISVSAIRDLDAVVETANTVFEDKGIVAVDFGDCATLIVEKTQYKRAYPLYINFTTSIQSTIENIKLGHLEDANIYSVKTRTGSDEVTVCYTNGASFVFERDTYFAIEDKVKCYMGALCAISDMIKA